jgi:hypothetical protein
LAIISTLTVHLIAVEVELVEAIATAPSLTRVTRPVC